MIAYNPDYFKYLNIININLLIYSIINCFSSYAKVIYNTRGRIIIHPVIVDSILLCKIMVNI